MSLLDKGNEDVVVYLSELTTDTDGNKIYRRSLTGIPAKARVQVLIQPGTSARRAEQGNEGYETEEVYAVRFRRDFPYTLDPYAQLDWNGLRWSLFGQPVRFNGSRRTARLEYKIRRT